MENSNSSLGRSMPKTQDEKHRLDNGIGSEQQPGQYLSGGSPANAAHSVPQPEQPVKFWDDPPKPKPWEAAPPENWEAPRPIKDSGRGLPYPIEHLPPLVRHAVEEVEETTQAPVAMIVASAMSVVSASVQGLVSVKRDEGLEGPASLYLLTVAKSGERKTACDKYFTASLREWEQERSEAGKPAKAEYRAQMAAWESAEQGYKETIKKAARGGCSFGGFDNPLLQHEMSRPKEPRIPDMLRGDDTPEALGVALMRWPVAALLSSEAGIIFGAHGMNPDSVMRNMAQFNVFWDGGRVKRDRTTTQSIDIEDVRVTVGLQVQPEVLENFTSKSGALARGIGYLARFLFAHPESTQGGRFYQPIKKGQPALAAFNARVRELLNFAPQVNDEGRLTTTYLELDPDAKRVWIAFHDEVEEKLGFGQEYFDVQDVASKAAENAARLACNFQMFDYPQGSYINEKNMLAAAEIMRWHLDEAMRFSDQIAVPQSTRNAIDLEVWIVGHCRTHGGLSVSTRNISQRGPNPTRNADKRDDALEILEAHNRVKVITTGAKKEVYLNPKVMAEYCRV